MVASAEAITADSEKYVEQLLQLFTRFSLLVNQVRSAVVTSCCKAMFQILISNQISQILIRIQSF